MLAPRPLLAVDSNLRTRILCSSLFVVFVLLAPAVAIRGATKPFPESPIGCSWSTRVMPPAIECRRCSGQR